MMSSLVQFAVWEWINIALEYVAVAWVRLPRLFLAVVAVNLVTHPAVTLSVACFGDGGDLVITCEIAAFVIEWLLLVAVYGRMRWRLLSVAAFVMNAVSCGTGLLLKT